MAVVYTAVNKENGHSYIGVTNGALRRRQRAHELAHLRGDKGAPVFYRALRKYGVAAFEWAVVSEHESFEDALSAEMRAIAARKPEYNITQGGQGALGNTLSPDTRQKIRLAHLGKKRPSISESLRAWHRSVGHSPPKHRKKIREVVCLNDGLVFKNCEEAARHYGVCASQVNSVCHGKSHKTGRSLFFDFSLAPLSAGERAQRIHSAKLAERQNRQAAVGAEERVRRSERARAHAHTADEKERRAAALRGMKRSDDVKHALRERGVLNKDKWAVYAALGPEALARKVICEATGTVYDSASEAARQNGVARSALIELCLGQRGRKTVGGKVYRYVG